MTRGGVHPAGAGRRSPPFDLSRDPFGKLCYADGDGRIAVGANVLRAFPLSDPGRWISICDGMGNELAWVESLDELDGHVRQMIEDELAEREFTPIIQRIVSSSGATEPCEWDVETDRGRTRLVLKSEDDVRRLGAHAALIRDAGGVRYLVSDSRRLDFASRRIIERYL